MIIECKDVSYMYDMPGDSWALQDINLTLRPGEKVMVAGPAGSGKTTLIELLDALILPTRGDVFFDGQSVRSLSKAGRLASIRKRIGVLFQFPEHQFFHETAYDELVFAAKNLLHTDEQDIQERALGIITGLNLDMAMLKEVSPFYLSSGEKRRLAIASALMIFPEIVIMDEPTAGMDAQGRREFVRIIESLQDTTVVVVTHNQEDFLGIIDRIIGLSDGFKVIDVSRDGLIDLVEDMEMSGIIPPLVLRLQSWLKKSGVDLDHPCFDMNELISMLKLRV